MMPYSINLVFVGKKVCTLFPVWLVIKVYETFYVVFCWSCLRYITIISFWPFMKELKKKAYFVLLMDLAELASDFSTPLLFICHCFKESASVLSMYFRYHLKSSLFVGISAVL